MNLVRCFLMISALLVSTTSANAATFCVGSSTELFSALGTTSGNGEDDVIKIRSGTYSVSSGAVAFPYYTSESFGLTVAGGFVSLTGNPCIFQLGGPTQTVLSGSGVRQVMRLQGAPGTSGAISVNNLTFHDGLSTQQGAGLALGGAAGFVGDLSVSRVIFDNNVSTTFGGGLALTADGGAGRISNSLFVNNRCAANYCAAVLTINAASAVDYRAIFDFNTVVANTCTNGAPPDCIAGGVRIGGSARALFNSNAFALNSGGDLYLQNSTSDVRHNNVVTLIGTPANQSGNFALVNPLFVDPLGSDFRLSFASPLVNNGLGVGLATVDLDGKPRVNDNFVDIGAYENQNRVFKGDFEQLF
jgi:hypothetical protein